MRVFSRLPERPDKTSFLVNSPYQMQESSEELPRRVPLAIETARALRLAISRGTWVDFLPGERDLCARFQVSRPTLRAALEELASDGEIERTPRKRCRILSSPAPRTLRRRESRVIAAIASRPLLAMPPSAVVMVDELRANLARAGFQLELMVSPACFSKRPERALRELTSRIEAAAWITFGSREPMQRWFSRSALPCLVAGSCAPGIPLPSVDLDYRAACRHAGGLLRKGGHRHIALCLPEGATGGEALSEEGLREALAGDPSMRLTVFRHDGTPENLRAHLDALMSRATPPSAILVARAAHVLTVLTHLQRKGLHIPRDVAIVSRDDESYLAHLSPTIARYQIDPALFPRRLSLAARQLAETGTFPPHAVRLIPRYLPGDSV
jgi:DNA-binding LacI/PurR family transcriptional regulator